MTTRSTDRGGWPGSTGGRSEELIGRRLAPVAADRRSRFKDAPTLDVFDNLIGFPELRIPRWGGFERIFTRPSYESARSREEWQGFMHALASVFDGTRVAEIAVREGWVKQDRLIEIVGAFERFGADTSNCFALPWCEALAFKPA